MKTVLQATVTTVLGLALFGLALFWPAGTFDYWQAWVFIAVFAGLGGIYTVYLGVKNPDAELDGYRDYSQNVRYRLVPHVW